VAGSGWPTPDFRRREGTVVVVVVVRQWTMGGRLATALAISEGVVVSWELILGTPIAAEAAVCPVDGAWWMAAVAIRNRQTSAGITWWSACCCSWA